MAAKGILRTNLKHFTNPNDKHYAMAEELRPTFVLDAEDLAVWDRIAPWLAMQDRLKPWYMDTLCEYCRVVANITRIAKFFRENGNTEYYEINTRNGLQKKAMPQVAQLNENRRMLRSYVGDFGLTPASEKQLDVLQEDLFGNPFDEFKQVG